MVISFELKRAVGSKRWKGKLLDWKRNSKLALLNRPRIHKAQTTRIGNIPPKAQTPILAANQHRWKLPTVPLRVS